MRNIPVSIGAAPYRGARVWAARRDTPSLLPCRIASRPSPQSRSLGAFIKKIAFFA